MLEHEPPDSEVVSWTPSGMAFQVKDQEVFANEVLVRYYKHSKFSSFQRQLNLYGFRKVIKGPEQGAYIHPGFQRAHPELLGEVRRAVVPNYPLNAENEIHGQHHRHHPPKQERAEGAPESPGPGSESPGEPP
ncbi:unnamed protein product, partial [Phaeothamnion confervicola]